jgi:ABC-2 type transport system permease protein
MMFPIIFIVPFVQLIVLVYAATFEMKSIKTCIVDLDHSVTSRQLISKIRGTPFYTIRAIAASHNEAEELLQKGSADLVIEFPRNFEKDLINNQKAVVQILANAINGTAAGLSQAYTTRIISDFNLNYLAARQGIIGPLPFKTINITYSYWYNPRLNFKTFMVPGILVLLVTIISLLLSGMNIVREKEMGTIEQINVTPIKKYQFIAGKLIPFWIIALFELALGLTLGKILFNIPIVGSLWLIFGIVSIYLVGILSLGLFVSTVTNTQQQSMFISFFFMMIFILMSGLFTSVDSMPEWAKIINTVNPVAYLIKMMRMIMLKGSGFADVQRDVAYLSVLVFTLLTLAIRRYRKVA